MLSRDLIYLPGGTRLLGRGKPCPYIKDGVKKLVL